MPSSRQAKMTRKATSPRFAIRIFLNITARLMPRPLSWLGATLSLSKGRSSHRPDGEEPLAILHRLAVFDVDVHDFAVVLGIDLVHQLHRFDDAEHLPLAHGGAYFDKRRRARFGRPIERADDRRFHHC